MVFVRFWAAVWSQTPNVSHFLLFAIFPRWPPNSGNLHISACRYRRKQYNKSKCMFTISRNLFLLNLFSRNSKMATKMSQICISWHIIVWEVIECKQIWVNNCNCRKTNNLWLYSFKFNKLKMAAKIQNSCQNVTNLHYLAYNYITHYQKKSNTNE